MSAPLARLFDASPVALALTTPRPRELHGRVAPADVPALADFACGTLGADLIAILAEDRRETAGAFVAHYVFAHPTGGWLLDASTPLDARAPELPSLAPFCYPASRFEREIQDLFGIRIAGHPDPRPLVRHGFWPDDLFPLRKDARPASFADDGRPFPFTEVGGEGVYEIPVGPVHAGVIEPGHFRFSVMGETIIDMKSRLYFTHKGIEKLFEGRAPAAGVELAERISGDTTIGHTLAYCRAIESAAGIEAPPRAELLRVVLLELERIYNHVADFGAIVGDTGFALAQAHCLRIRERLLRFNRQLTGSRLLRGALVPGGLAADVPLELPFADKLDAVLADFDEIVSISLSNTLVRDRLERTGTLSTALAKEHGVVGYVARAAGVDVDARRDHAAPAYGRLGFRVVIDTAGDVRARATVRVGEVRESARLVREAIASLPRGSVRATVGRLEPWVPAIGIVEGWRGRIVHWVMAAADGSLHRVKIVDPSFFNWPALSHALMGNIVPDFPLCNKSFNQSYSGNDL